MPENSVICQTIGTADANTFHMYFDNMRQLFLDKFTQISSCGGAGRRPDRGGPGVRAQGGAQASRGTMRANTPTAASPTTSCRSRTFDIDADVIEISNKDFGIWLLDASDPEKYAGQDRALHCPGLPDAGWARMSLCPAASP